MKKSIVETKILTPPSARLSVKIDGKLWVKLTSAAVTLHMNKNAIVSEALEMWLGENVI